MTSLTHKFKVGQTVELIRSISRAAASGHYQIVSLRPAEGDGLQYRIESRSEAHERSRRAISCFRHVRFLKTEKCTDENYSCRAPGGEPVSSLKEVDDVQGS
jgi:hypothetical protein